MDLLNRYEIIETIAQGEFATVYRARDRELPREVAIKQIHEQYLHDPAQLERYWQEAQLLASLEHPYILTIYDVSRERGWLILELMQGNLPQRLGGQPIDLDFLRVTLICALHALRVLEQNAIVHGDIKPTNLLLDKSNRVKIGDFGIARRLSSGEGSLVKGSTKYMAPEVVSDQFGEIGPHSDLYSLGFSAYELMCGANFENLFPGLDMFAGNRQMAWIMWHAAADRQLPEIRRVLEGVPDDLIHVIQKLTIKDPAKRYRSAEEAMADLRTKGQLPQRGAAADDEAVAAEEAAKKDKSKRRLMIGALAVSILLSLGMLMMPSGAESPPPPVTPSTSANKGVVLKIGRKPNQFFLEPDGGGKPVPIEVRPGVDRILLDDARVTLADLEVGDRIVIQRFKSDDGHSFMEIVASRDIADASGVITSIDSNNTVITITGNEGEPLPVYVPTTAKIELNGNTKIGSRAISFADLKKQDRVEVRHVPGDGPRRATSLRVEREISLEGTIAFLNPDSQELTVRVSDGSNSTLKRLRLSEDCEIALNGKKESSGNPLSLAELAVGDQVTATHDSLWIRIDAERRVEFQGTLQNIDYESRSFEVLLEESQKTAQFTMAEGCTIQTADDRETVDLQFLQEGDQVTVIRDAKNLKSPTAVSIEVIPNPNEQVWAVVIGQQKYGDGRLAPLPYTLRDAQLVYETLRKYYRVASDQILLEVDATRGELEERIAQHVEGTEPESQLIVYFSGHAYLPASGSAVLAARDFDPEEMERTGLPLDWLLDQLESCPAQEKMLILDTCHASEGAFSKFQPSSSELAASLKPSPNRPISKSVDILTSCSRGERGHDLQDERSGVFARHLAAAFRGGADDNRDHHINAFELSGFVRNAMAAQSTVSVEKQTPTLYRADPTPARLSDEAQEAARNILAYLARGTIKADALKAEVEAAEALAPNQPDFKLAAALVLLEQGATAASREYFNAERDNPDALVALHGLVWLEFLDRDYEQGVAHLTRLVGSLPKPKREVPYGPYAKHLFQWAGKLRTYLEQVAAKDEPQLTAGLGEAIATHGEEAEQLYETGGDEVRRVMGELREDYELALTEDKKDKIRFRAKQLRTYAKFDFAAAAAYLRSQLDN